MGAGQSVGTTTTSALESEIQALLIAMQHCWSKGYRKIHFEGDNKEVSEIIHGKKANFSVFNWTREVQAWRAKFEECCFSWVRRSSNMVADTLAKHQLPANTLFCFHDFVPHVITDSLHRDYVTTNQ